MKVSVYKLEGGRIDIMVEASPGSRKAPVVLQDVKKGNLKEEVHKVVTLQRGRKEKARAAS